MHSYPKFGQYLQDSRPLLSNLPQMDTHNLDVLVRVKGLRAWSMEIAK